jgi:hypothetical protein
MMAIYSHEHDLPGPPWRRAVARADWFDSRISMMAFLKANPTMPLGLSDKYIIPGRSPAERKARADKIAVGLGAITEWRNGYYMARLHGLDIHFDLPIFLADVGSDGADGRG